MKKPPLKKFRILRTKPDLREAEIGKRYATKAEREEGAAFYAAKDGHHVITELWDASHPQDYLNEGWACDGAVYPPGATPPPPGPTYAQLREFVERAAGWVLDGEKPPKDHTLNEDSIDSEGRYDMSIDEAFDTVRELVDQARTLIPEAANGRCTIEGAHCQDCGAREFETDPVKGPVCAECGGDLTNEDDCEGGH